jgi:hypothetical protein
MEPDEFREIAERDQFWSSLRALLPTGKSLEGFFFLVMGAS